MTQIWINSIAGNLTADVSEVEAIKSDVYGTKARVWVHLAPERSIQTFQVAEVDFVDNFNYEVTRAAGEGLRKDLVHLIREIKADESRNHPVIVFENGSWVAA